MVSSPLKKLVEQYVYLFWDCPTSGLSKKAIVERFLLFGDQPEIREMIRIIGKENVITIFKEQLQKQKLAYPPKLINFFSLVFGIKNEIPYRDIIARAKKNTFLYRKV